MKARTIAVCLTALVCAKMAVAGSITVSYSGFISSATLPGISVGDPFSGYFTYSVPNAPLSNNPSMEFYQMDQPGNGIYFTVDGYWFSAAAAPLLEMMVEPNFSNGSQAIDYLNIEQGPNPQGVFSTNYPGSFTFGPNDVEICGPPGYLPSTAIPDPFNTSDVIFDQGFCSVAWAAINEGGKFYQAVGTINRIQATTPTPEPVAPGLVGLGLTLIVVKRHRAGAGTRRGQADNRR